MAKQKKKKAAILYFEDNCGFLDRAVFDLKKAFPEYDIVGNWGYEDWADDVFKEIKGIEKIAIVCTDGSLRDGLKGWSIVEELRQRGYAGPALYTGYSDLPEDKKHLYVGRCEKSGESLVKSVREHLSC